ncbi:MAG: hypothetical protein AB1630_10840 [bacterium]
MNRIFVVVMSIVGVMLCGCSFFKHDHDVTVSDVYTVAYRIVNYYSILPVPASKPRPPEVINRPRNVICPGDTAYAVVVVKNNGKECNHDMTVTWTVMPANGKPLLSVSSTYKIRTSDYCYFFQRIPQVEDIGTGWIEGRVSVDRNASPNDDSKRATIKITETP